MTWEELIAQPGGNGNGHFGLVLPGQGDPAQRTFSDFLWQAGGEWVDEKNKPSFNSAAGIEALTFHHDLIQQVQGRAARLRLASSGTRTRRIRFGFGLRTFNWPGSFATLSNAATSKHRREMVDRALCAAQDRDLLRDLAWRVDE